MAQVPLSNVLQVTLAGPMPKSSAYKTIRVLYGERYALDISLRRTIRVPDNGTSYELPPDCGPFPIFSVSAHKERLPKSMSAKGGLFIPIYEREAMWIKFSSHRPFAIKVHAGGINAVSGERQPEDGATLLRRKATLEEGKSIQDYVVSGSQKWLDGIATLDGKVMQFVATPTGSGYSVESQSTGRDSVDGIQFEVMPTKGIDTGMCILVKTLQGTVHVLNQVSPSTTISEVKSMLYPMSNVPTDQQRLIYGGRQLEDGRTLFDYNISYDCMLHMVLSLRGGGGHLGIEEYMLSQELAENNAARREENTITSEMVIAPGGFIKQTIAKDPVEAEDWDKENIIMFNLHLLNASVFEQVIGIKAPPTPITPEVYTRYGYAFSKLYEEKSGIKGDFEGVKSVGDLDREKGVESTYDGDEIMQFPVVELNSVDKRSLFFPVSDLEAAVKKIRIFK